MPDDLRTEGELEQRFVLPETGKVLQGLQGRFDVCVHPWKTKGRCLEHGGTRSDLGCPRCWKESKEWASVHLWGMQHSFDLAIRDRAAPDDSLVVEAKLVSFVDDRPNGEIQRFFGQCSLARTKHKIVIGFCAYRGVVREKFWHDTDAATRWFGDAGVRIVFRSIDKRLAES